MRGAHIQLGLVFLLLTGVGAGMASAAERDEEAVRVAVSRFAEAWNRHDMDAFGALFTRDADFVNVTGQLWKGRQEGGMQNACADKLGSRFHLHRTC